MDDMNNWGDRKQVLAEADLFTIEPENEMYAHLNVNYLKIDKLPRYKEGWQPVVDALRHGKFFSSTGEVLIPEFTVDRKSTGEEIANGSKNSTVSFKLKWTFPMNYAEIILRRWPEGIPRTYFARQYTCIRRADLQQICRSYGQKMGQARSLGYSR